MARLDLYRNGKPLNKYAHLQLPDHSKYLSFKDNVDMRKGYATYKKNAFKIKEILHISGEEGLWEIYLTLQSKMNDKDFKVDEAAIDDRSN